MRTRGSLWEKVVALSARALPVFRCAAIALVFLLTGFEGTGVMRLHLDKNEFLFSIWASMAIALMGGVCAWLVFRLWSRNHPFICAAAMGYFSGIAGAGACILLAYLLAGLGPIGGIYSTMP